MRQIAVNDPDHPLPLAAGVAPVGRLDFDHLGPEIPEDRAGQRADRPGGPLDDFDPLQRSGHGTSLCRPTTGLGDRVTGGAYCQSGRATVPSTCLPGC